MKMNTGLSLVCLACAGLVLPVWSGADAQAQATAAKSQQPVMKERVAGVPERWRKGEVEERFPLLGRLTPPKATLPRGCAVANGSPPVEGLQNLSITTNSRAIIFVDEPLTELLKTNIEAMYYAVYREKGELGIFGWTFKSEEAAREARDKLVEKHKDRFRVWLNKNCVLCLWRDLGATDECFQFFETFLQRRVDDFAAGKDR